MSRLCGKIEAEKSAGRFGASNTNPGPDQTSVVTTESAMPHSTPNDWLCKIILDSFWEYVDKSGDCWIWTGPVHSKRWGYGSIRVLGRKSVLAHRLIWHLVNGPIPDKLMVLHSCDNTMCVRPDHLWLGTSKDNMDDMIRKGRGRGGAARVLPDDVVRQIKTKIAEGMKPGKIAKAHGLSYATVYRIASGKKYADVV